MPVIVVLHHVFGVGGESNTTRHTLKRKLIVKLVDCEDIIAKHIYDGGEEGLVEEKMP